MKRINKAKRAHLLRCVEEIQQREALAVIVELSPELVALGQRIQGAMTQFQAAMRQAVMNAFRLPPEMLRQERSG